MPSFLHNHDLGDVITSLSSVQHAGGGDFYFSHTGLLDVLKKLLSSQDYIKIVDKWNGEKIDYDFTGFRKGQVPWGRTLSSNQAVWVKIDPDLRNPWLKIDPNPKTKDKIIVNNTKRYRNRFFPWKEIVDIFREDILFIGLINEWREFCRIYGSVNRLITSDMYEVASAIEGCELFIGNQSAPMAICEGLKHRSIQEVCLHIPDCIYPRDNAIYCYNGELEFEACGKKFYSPQHIFEKKINTIVTPPGGWKVNIYEKDFCYYDINLTIQECSYYCKLKKLPIPNDLKIKIINETYNNLPVSGNDINTNTYFLNLKSLIDRKDFIK